MCSSLRGFPLCPVTGRMGKTERGRRDMTVWHEDDRFWELFAPKLFTGDHWERAAREVEQAIALLEIQPGARILDLCCGPGRHSLEFARRGYRVTGVDRTAGYLEAAREKAAREGLDIEFIQEDMRTFRRPGFFDAAINLYTSFGYFDDPAQDRKVSGNILAGLKPGGRLVMEMMGKEVLARVFRERDWYEKDGVFLLEERRIDSGWDWIRNRWILIGERERTEYRLEHRLYSGSELSALLSQAGFRSVKLFGHLSGIPYDQSAERLVAVAEK